MNEKDYRKAFEQSMNATLSKAPKHVQSSLDISRQLSNAYQNALKSGDKTGFLMQRKEIISQGKNQVSYSDQAKTIKALQSKVLMLETDLILEKTRWLV